MYNSNQQSERFAPPLHPLPCAAMFHHIIICGYVDAFVSVLFLLGQCDIFNRLFNGLFNRLFNRL
jgi:hypothetical protein